MTTSKVRLVDVVPVWLNLTRCSHHAEVNNFLARFNGPPKILELDHLSVTVSRSLLMGLSIAGGVLTRLFGQGDVFFGADVTLKGTVIIVASEWRAGFRATLRFLIDY